MGALIDSSVFVSAERGGFDLGTWLAASEDSFAISAITASELLHGVHRAPAGRRRERRRTFVQAILDTYPIHPVDAAVAEVHAATWATLATRGTLIGAHDLLIAATGLMLDFAIVTFNARDFERVPRLKVVVPTQLRQR